MDTEQAREHLATLEAAAEHYSVPFFGDRVMHWRAFGKGPPLVLIHGGHGSWLHWARNVEALAQHHRLLVPNMPGYGDSHDPPVETGIQKIAEFVIASLDTLLGGRHLIDVAAFSFGGAVASRIAVERGAVRRLALLGSATTGTPRRPRTPLFRWRKEDADEQRIAFRHNLVAHMLYDESSADELALEIYADAVTRTRFRSSGSIVRNVMLDKVLSSYAEPVLFVWGEHDVTSTPELARRTLVNGHPRRACRVICDAGHWVQFERPDTVNPLLARWFETNT